MGEKFYPLGHSATTTESMLFTGEARGHHPTAAHACALGVGKPGLL